MTFVESRPYSKYLSVLTETPSMYIKSEKEIPCVRMWLHTRCRTEEISLEIKSYDTHYDTLFVNNLSLFQM